MNRREALKAFAAIPAGVAAVALAPKPAAAAVTARAVPVPDSTAPPVWWHGVEEFTGTGLTRTFTLRNKMDGHYGYVVNDDVYETLVTAGFGGAAWTYDPKDNTVTRDMPPAYGAVVRVLFNCSKEC